MSKKTYYATVAGMIDGTHRKINDKIEMSERQAKYLVMSGLLSAEPVEKKEAAKAAAADEARAELADRSEPSPSTLDMKTRKN